MFCKTLNKSWRIMQDLIDFASDNTQTGFRLHKMEVFNWGTFNRKSWKIAPCGSNSLLTGDIGSGKSTLVDAITTLLVPHQKITYNKAAGAESKERTIYSYLRGEYKNEKDEFTQASKKVYLRDENTYSVLLANFQNSGYNSNISIAQVFWLKNDRPEKNFCHWRCGTKPSGSLFKFWRRHCRFEKKFEENGACWDICRILKSIAIFFVINSE